MLYKLIKAIAKYYQFTFVSCCSLKLFLCFPDVREHCSVAVRNLHNLQILVFQSGAEFCPATNFKCCEELLKLLKLVFLICTKKMSIFVHQRTPL